MAQRLPWRKHSMFGAKFGLALILLAPLWWLCLPFYGWLLIQTCGSVLRGIFGLGIVAGYVQVQGILNTESLLVFHVGERALTMKFALLVTNLPPFLALIVATPCLDWRQRLRVFLEGSAILVAVHFAYVVIALRFADVLANHDAVATAMSQFLLTLPFLLWTTLAYWKKI